MNHNELKISNISTRQWAFILWITFLGGLMFWQLKIFIPAFLGAYTLYVLFRKWMFKLQKKFKGKTVLSALLLMLISFVIVLLPINGLLNIFSSRILPFLKYSDELWILTQKWIHNFETLYGFSLLTEQNLTQIEEWVKLQLQQLAGATFNSLVTVMVMYFLLFFMLIEAKKFEKICFQWLPLKARNIIYVKQKLNHLVMSNAIGIPLVVLCQSLVALIGFWIAGVEEPFLWFIATCVAAVIPILGSALVYVPLSCILIAKDQMIQGFFLLFYGFLIVGSIDNIFRFWLQKRLNQVHPLITVFGVMMGLNLFGFIGLIFGPILISLLLLFLQIYNKEFNQI